ncbi:hypothetical protein BN8_01755 [Fibrisoma limi BUZ 3]|uniref:Uncharacterized protein n=1 Tax=Fibrisoma limi BUZ 3 TaxID=1185876 RepID=I2GFQ8_9BACT|nr:hypothetical protein [Fibrisoma limi]CCH52733.1 hypothetical protein BN8_01755 [Fibrisoma limi BUZ 3]
MKTLISERLATNGLLAVLSLVIIFHLLVLLRIIPYSIVWGGRLTSDTQMVRFELTSIVINALMLTVVAIRAGLLRIRVPALLINITLWLMAGLFTLNTVGNMASLNTVEQLVFTPLTLILAIFSLRLALAGYQRKSLPPNA